MVYVCGLAGPRYKEGDAGKERRIQKRVGSAGD